MSSAVRLSAYPLESVRDRERWKLETLQSRLAAAAADRLSTSERHRCLIDALRSAAADATATVGSVIDPAAARRQLRHVEDLQGAAVTSARAVEASDAFCNGLRRAVDAQRVRLESIERHRRDFQRHASLEAERLQGIEAERAWLARSAWKTRSDRGSTGMSPSRLPALGVGRT